MQTEKEARSDLAKDSEQSLHSTFDEYCPDTPLPTNRDAIIDAIIGAMQHEGHVEKPTTTVKLSTIARELNINPKVARDKLRRAHAKNLAPPSIKAAGWVFDHRDKAAIVQIIKRKSDGDL